MSLQTFEICLYRGVKPHVDGITNKGVSYADLIEPRYVAVEIIQIDQTKVMTCIKAQTRLARHLCRTYRCRYGRSGGRRHDVQASYA